jgi:hypothetical protein
LGKDPQEFGQKGKRGERSRKRNMREERGREIERAE